MCLNAWQELIFNHIHEVSIKFQATPTIAVQSSEIRLVEFKKSNRRISYTNWLLVRKRRIDVLARIVVPFFDTFYVEPVAHTNNPPYTWNTTTVGASTHTFKNEHRDGQRHHRALYSV